MLRIFAVCLLIQVFSSGIVPTRSQEWRTIQKTLSPPSSNRPRVRTIMDSIRAVEAARLRASTNNYNSYQQKELNTPVTLGQHSGHSARDRQSDRYHSNSLQTTPANVLERVSSIQQTVDSMDTLPKNYQAISNIGNTKQNNNNRNSISPTTFGVNEEAVMLGTRDTNVVVDGGAIAIYAMDPHGHHDFGTTTKKERMFPTAQSNTRRSSTAGFRVLPNGSIVNFGRSSTIRSDGRPTVKPQIRQVTEKRTTPVSSVWRPVSFLEQNEGLMPTSGLTPTLQRYQGPTESSKLDVHANISPTRAFHTPVPLLQPFTDSRAVSNIVDDPQRQMMDDPRGNFLRIVKGHLFGMSRKTPFAIKLSDLSSNTSISAELYQAHTHIPLTTREQTTTPTTTTSTTTTTPKPTPPKPTQHPDEVAFYGQGGVPINITYRNDNHVCPSSRARWQDFTVYLETKPRLCMIQITFNARYKREAIYTDTWWSNTVDYIYKTVYDPVVTFLDAYKGHTLDTQASPLQPPY